MLTGKVTSLSPGPRGTLNVNVSLIKAYKDGRLTITQVGETMSVKLVSQCKKCPLFRRGTTTLDTRVPHSVSISIFFSDTLYNTDQSLCSCFCSNRHQLHHHGPSGWRRTWHPAARCIHSSIQSPTSQTINEYQQPALLTSRFPSRPGHSDHISKHTWIRTLQCENTDLLKKHNITVKKENISVNVLTHHFKGSYSSTCQPFCL